MNPIQYTISATQKRNQINTVCGSYSTGKGQRESFAKCSFYQSDFSDEGNACGFSNSKAQRERFAERYDFSATNATVRDEETGYGYFGARYMDHELMTMWLSVDPMAEKYPGISPYAYCAWNPVKLVDPDGEEFTKFKDENGQLLDEFNDGSNAVFLESSVLQWI